MTLAFSASRAAEQRLCLLTATRSDMHRLRGGPRQDPFLEVSRVSVGRALSRQTAQAWRERVVPVTKVQWDVSDRPTAPQAASSSRSLCGFSLDPPLR